MTDLYPNVPAFEAIAAQSERTYPLRDRVRRRADVPSAPDRPAHDLQRLPSSQAGDARSVLHAAAAARQPIVVFEVSERALAHDLPILLTPLVVWMATPFMRPFLWRRLFWTYLCRSCRSPACGTASSRSSAPIRRTSCAGSVKVRRRCAGISAPSRRQGLRTADLSGRMPPMKTRTRGPRTHSHGRHWSHARRITAIGGLPCPKAAGKWLASLSDDQRQRATFAFDADERMKWHFVPNERFPAQGRSDQGNVRGAADARVGPVEDRPQRARLHHGAIDHGAREHPEVRRRAAGRFARDHEAYQFSVFGTPGDAKAWGWRFEGHHVSVRFDVVERIAHLQHAEFLRYESRPKFASTCRVLRQEALASSARKKTPRGRCSSHSTRPRRRPPS